MRCKACGKVIDDTSRFCTYCDHDNYPEMNQVKTKGAKPDVLKNGQNYYTAPSKPSDKKNADSKGKGCGFAIIIIVAVLIMLIRILSNL